MPTVFAKIPSGFHIPLGLLTRGLALTAVFFEMLLIPGSATSDQTEVNGIEAIEDATDENLPTATTRPSPSDAPIAPITKAPRGPKSETAAPPEDLTPSTSDPIPDASDTPEVPTEVGWADRALVLAREIDTGQSKPEQADVLYEKLASELWAYQDEVSESLRTRSPDALDQRTKLSDMYGVRLQLLESVTPALRSQLFGGGRVGMREFQREFANVKLNLSFQTLAIPRGLRQIAEGVRVSPLNDLWRLFELFFGVVVFRLWRRWAKTGLTELRQQVLSIQPRTDLHLQVARFLWYLDRFRAPLEWLALLSFASAIFEPGDLEEVSTLVWVILLWALLTRFGLLLVNALAARGAGGPNRRNGNLQLRSLRLVAAWILLTGLGLDLIYRYVGEAAIYAWATRVFLFLLVPVLLLFLHWWRPEIIQRLKVDSAFSATARRMGKREKGFGSYPNAAAGVVYILGAELAKLVIRIASRFEGGRNLVATLLRREVERSAQREHLTEKPISEDLVLELLTPDDTVIDGPFREGIGRIKALVETGRGASVVLLAERGGGASTFLDLLKTDVGEKMRIIDCPPGGPEKLGETLASEFGLGSEADLLTGLRPRLDAAGVRVIAIKNYHRVARPVMGGLEGMNRASRISEAVGEDVLWILSLARASWPYIKSLLGDRAILEEILEIPPWSEAQLEQLFDARCKKAGIEPDYRRLIFPRQFDDGESASLEARNRFSFRRVLWELSNGNPEIAIRLFTDSLRELPNGELIVRLPQLASSDKLAAANPTTMLVLKVLIETEMATVDDLQGAIREPRAAMVNSLAHCIQQGWVEPIVDHYQITWAAYRKIKRALIRQGLIAR